MHLFELNNDALQHICDRLAGKDALNLSLVAKHLHPLAINRVVAMVTTTHPKALRAFHDYVLDSNRPRVQHVEGIDVQFMSFFADAECVTSVLDDSEDEIHYTYDNQPILLFIEILERAHRLRSLTMDPRLDLMMRSTHSGRFASALTSATLCQLRWAKLASVDNNIVELIGKTRWDLRVLSLDCSNRSSGNHARQGSTRILFHSLLQTLTNFPHLHTLEVINLNDTDWYIFKATAPSPLDSQRYIFPTIRRLYLGPGANLPALDLIGRCPRSVLVALQDGDGPAMDPGFGAGNAQISCVFPPWPSLYSLKADIIALHKACCERGLVKVQSVHHFEHSISLRSLAVDEDRNIRETLCMLRRLSPVWAQLHIEVAGVPMDFWTQIPGCAPRLRYLDLRTTKPPEKDLESNSIWLDNVPPALSYLPLVYLGIEIIDWNFRVEWDRTPTFRDKGDAAAMALPQQCARAIPTLRFFKLSHSLRDGSPCAEDEADEEVDRIEREELEPFKDYNHPASAGSWELEKSGRIGMPLQQVRLWRMEGEGDQRWTLWMIFLPCTGDFGAVRMAFANNFEVLSRSL
ncbi:hypothetical protein C8Q80DRAFT_1269148 [Daedaleopsis nitida]|nr:hypothetical protein C8Q80DRAFT_1269148 [Daedaleopsis nitida]